MLIHCIYYHRVWRLNVQECPWHSNDMPWSEFVCLNIFCRVLHVRLYEINVRRFKLIEYCIWVGNVLEITPKVHPRVLEEDPKPVDKVVPAGPKWRSGRRLVGLSTPHQWMSSMGTWPWVRWRALKGDWTNRQFLAWPICGLTPRRWCHK